MAKIFIKDTEEVVDIEVGQTILDACEKGGVHIDQACGGVCGCSTCHIWVEAGEPFLEEASEKEEDRLERAKGTKLNSRLACQSVLQEDEDITIKLPPQKGLH